MRRLKKNEINFFDIPEIEDQKIEETESTTKKAFSIHSLSFKEQNKWQFSDGENIFWVRINDGSFLKKINDCIISFSKGDQLIVMLKTTQWETADGLKTEYEAIEILEHKSGARQIPLPFEKENKQN